MAYVKITDSLLSEVTAKIDRMQHTALGTYALPEIEEGSDMEKDLLAAALDHVWAIAPELRFIMPDSFLVSCKEVRVKMESDVTKHPDARKLIHPISGETDDGVAIQVPMGGHIEASGYYQPTYSAEIVLPWEGQPESVQRYVSDHHDLAAERTEVARKYDTVAQQVVNFLRSHTSLNVAVKEMPELEMYLTDHIKERLYKKSPKRANVKADKPAVDVDRDAIAELAVADRIANSR